MTDSESGALNKPASGMNSRLTLMIIGGAILLSLGLIGIVWVSFLPKSGDIIAADVTFTPESATVIDSVTSTEDGVTGVQIVRAVGALMTPLPTATPTATLTPSPTSTEPPAATDIPPTGTIAPTSIPQTPEPPAEIFWTQEEKNALGWLCYGEVGGMGSQKIDACLSVLSTVRARYAYPNSFPETDVMGTLLRPGQFNVTVYTDRPGPDPDLNWAIEQYITGMRGSCNGYLFFDSVPGGPSLCQIYSSYGWIEFHNGWN